MDNMKSRSEDEDEDVLSTDPESKDKIKDKKALCKVKWSRDEDEKLKKLVEQHGTDSWKLVANYFPGRADGQCQHRWQKVLNPELVKGPWTKEEDQRVIDLVHKYGPKRWSVIAKHLQGRIGKQCRERWHNHLNPDVKKSSWTQEEDLIIYEAHKRLGNRWAEISKLLPGRTDNSIKNHWNSTMRRKVEHEGYLQESSRSISSSQSGMQRRHHRPCPSPIDTQLCDPSPPGMSGTIQMGGYPFSPTSGHIMDLPDTASFLSPACLDDPDKEQRIKELELLLMSAESEVRRQVECRGPCSVERFSWSDSLSDDTLTTSSSSLDQHSEGWRGPEDPRGPSAHLHVSPSKFLAVEASTVLSSLHTIPEFAETMELIDSMCLALQDPVAWSEVASFDLSEADTPLTETQESYTPQERMVDGIVYAVNPPSATPAMGKHSNRFGQGKTIPLAIINTPRTCLPSLGRRKKKEVGGQPPVSDRNLPSHKDSPKKTPSKSMPFSPSQFFNVSAIEHMSLENPALTSTPVCGQKCVINTPIQKETTPKHQKENAGFRTPKFRKTVMVPSPRTPTPFKNALAAQEKMHGPLKMVPQPLAFLEEDIREVLKEEAGSDIFNRTDLLPDFRTWKHDMDAPARKVRKSLVLDPWGKDCLNIQLFQDQLSTAQVPDENLVTSSLLMTTLPEREQRSHPVLSVREGQFTNLQHLRSPRGKKQHALNRSSLCSTPVQVKGEWETVVYGKTEDQLLMTEQARHYVSTYPSSSCTSRALVL